MVKNIIFPNNESAFVVLEPFINSEGYFFSPSFLFSKLDGGRSSEELRTRVVSFISLMQMLEEKRFVYVVEHSIQNHIFYEGSDNFTILPKLKSSEPKEHYTENVFCDTLDNGQVLTITVIVKDGSIESKNCNFNNDLVRCEMDSTIKKRLVHYLEGAVYPTTSLMAFVENGFKTGDEIATEISLNLASQQVEKAQKSVRIAILTLFVAVLTLLATFVSQGIGLISFCKVFYGIISCVLLVSLGYFIKSGEEGSV